MYVLRKSSRLRRAGGDGRLLLLGYMPCMQQAGSSGPRRAIASIAARSRWHGCARAAVHQVLLVGARAPRFRVRRRQRSSAPAWCTASALGTLLLFRLARMISIGSRLSLRVSAAAVVAATRPHWQPGAWRLHGDHRHRLGLGWGLGALLLQRRRLWQGFPGAFFAIACARGCCL